MKLGFTEFSYGYAFTENLMPGHSIRNWSSEVHLVH